MLIVYIKGNMLLDVITFSIVAIFIGTIYFPFMLRCLEAYKKVDDATFKKAFLSLSIMSICFILVFVFQIIDRIFMLLYSIPGYTVFYYLGWISAIVAILCAYLGYIKPKTQEK